MGLDTTHDCWHGAYSAFMRWRQELAKLAGLPPLDMMEGFYAPLDGERMSLPTLYCTNGNARECSHLKRLDEQLPIRWDCLKPDALHELLHHSDCDGEIPWERCGAIADSLEKLIPLMNGDGGGHIGNWKDKTQAFVDGLRLAAKEKENVEFH